MVVRVVVIGVVVLKMVRLWYWYGDGYGGVVGCGGVVIAMGDNMILMVGTVVVVYVKPRPFSYQPVTIYKQVIRYDSTIKFTI